MLDFTGQTVFYSTDFKLEFINADDYGKLMKCGEIFRHADGTFAMTCVYCNNQEFDDYFSLRDHINTHYNLLIEAPEANFNENADIPSFFGLDKSTASLLMKFLAACSKTTWKRFPGNYLL